MKHLVVHFRRCFFCKGDLLPGKGRSWTLKEKSKVTQLKNHRLLVTIKTPLLFPKNKLLSNDYTVSYRVKDCFDSMPILYYIWHKLTYMTFLRWCKSSSLGVTPNVGDSCHKTTFCHSLSWHIQTLASWKCFLSCTTVSNGWHIIECVVSQCLFANVLTSHIKLLIKVTIIWQHTEASLPSAYIQTEKHLFLLGSCHIAETVWAKLINFQWKLETSSDMSDSDRWQKNVGVSNDPSKLRKLWRYANVEKSCNYQWGG